MASELVGLETLHPALNRALDSFSASTRQRAATALRAALRERVQTDGERAWTSSRLTGDGFPVEITFTTADNRLRYTVEPASVYQSPRSRVQTAFQLINALDSHVVPDEVITVLKRIQDQGTLQFGAWLGGRHTDEDSEHKIYVEVPDGETGSVAIAGLPFAYPQPALPDRDVTLRMIAYSPTSRQWEMYFRVKSLAPYHLPRILAPAKLNERSEELLCFVSEAYGHPLRERLPGESVGVSYTLRAEDHTPQSVTLFFFARVFWGGDARIRHRVSTLAKQLNWDDTRYQQLTSPLETRRSWMTYHGILGITLAGNGQFALSIGVRPPEESQ